MRIHELVEEAVEYIAFDGVLGTEPTVLHQHLAKKNPSIDTSYFAYIYTLIIQHPSVQAVLTDHPIPRPDGSIRLGSERLPGAVAGDATPMEVDAGGTPAGERFMTSREVVVHKKEQRVEKAAEAKAAKAKARQKVIDIDGVQYVDKPAPDPDGESLIRPLRLNDGEGASDLRSLEEKWGSRLRLQCSDDEIFHRLTGTHQRSSKMTAVVFHVLTLVAKAREKGISMIELGPLVGASQGSMHYFVKILQGLGLCAKVPFVLHASITSLVVYHSFLQVCPVYRSMMGLDMVVSTMEAKDEADGDDEDLDGDDPSGTGNGPTSAGEWGFEFGPLTDSDLMAGHVVKERLIKLLDHPALENHLLKRMNLIPLLGWRGGYSTRQRRLFARHIQTLVNEGIVDNVFVGDKSVRCLRLAKYNPDRVKDEVRSPVQTMRPELAEAATMGKEDAEEDPRQILPDHVAPYHPLGGIAVTETVDFQITQLILRSGQNGLIMSTIRDSMFGFFKRGIEFYFLRLEKAILPPPHLQIYSTTTVMESYGKERRLRAFGVQAIRDVFRVQGQPTDDRLHPPLPHEAGHFEDLSFRAFFTTTAEYQRFLDLLHDNVAPQNIGSAKENAGSHRQPTQSVKKPSKPKSPPRKSIVHHTDEATEASLVPHALETNVKPREMKYNSEAQIRGRPRKYIHVVEEDGKINRRIIGSIYSSENLPPILIYVRSAYKIVPAPEGYTGLGPPPPVTEEQLQEGHPPEWYWKFKAHSPAQGCPAGARKGAAKKKAGKAGKTKKRVVKQEDAGGQVEEGQQGDDEEGHVSGNEEIHELADEPVVQDVAAGGTTSARSLSSPRQEAPKHLDGPAEVELDELLEDHEEHIRQAGLREGPAAGVRASGVSSAVHQPLASPQALSPDDIADVLQQVEKEAATGITTEEAIPGGDEAGPERNLNGSQATGPIDIHPAAIAHAKRKRGPSPDPLDIAPTSSDDRPGLTHDEHAKSLADKGSTANPVKRSRRLDAAMKAGVQPESLPTAGSKSASPARTDTAGASAPTIVDDPLPALDAAPVVAGTSEGFPAAGRRGRKRKSAAATSVAQVNAEPPSLSPVAKKSKPRKSKAAESVPIPIPDTTHDEPPSHIASESGLPLPSTLQVLQSDSAATKSPSIPFRSATTQPVDGVSAAQETPAGVPSALVPANDPAGSTLPAHVGQVGSVSSTTAPFSVASPDYTGGAVTHDFPQTPMPTGNTGRKSFDLQQTPLRTPVTPGTPWSNGTPLGHTGNGKHHLLPDGGGSSRSGRMDLSGFKKANEVIQALISAGGVLTEHKLWLAHKAWTYKVAGSDTLHAPPVGYLMDRNVFKRTRTRLLDDGRLKSTVAAAPSATGRWTKNIIDYLPDLTPSALQAYIRSLAVITQVATTPKATPTQKIAAASFTEVRLPVGGRGPLLEASHTALGDSDISPEDRRAAMLKETNVIGFLYGYLSGRVARAQVLHQAIARAIATQDTLAVLSRTPRVFTIPLLTESITIGEWVTVVPTSWYSEAFIDWMKDPLHRQTLLRDMPKELRPPAGFGGHRAKQHIQTLLDLMVTLQLITPLIPAEGPEADLIVHSAAGEDYRFRIAPSTATMHYVFHDYAPIFRISSDDLPLLGEQPLLQSDDIPQYWSRLQTVSLESSTSGFESSNLQADQPTSRHAFPDARGPHHTDYDLNFGRARPLRNPLKWSSDLKPHPAQKAALDKLVDHQTGERKVVSAEDVSAFAWEWALPADWVESYLSRQSETIRSRATERAQRLQEAAKKTFERREQAQKALLTKLAAQQQHTKQQWEARIKRIGEKVGVGFSKDLVDFISRQSLMTVKHRGLTDTDVEHSVRVYARSKGMGSGITGFSTAVQSGVPRPRFTRRPRKDKKVKGKRPNGARRNRRAWNHEEDELLLDSEAIIRARNRGIPNNRGRAAVAQVLGQGSAQIWNGRLKKILAAPGKFAYLERLSDVWYDLWNQHRGTAELPDEDPKSNTNFDLRKHIDFLRSKVNKAHVKLDATTLAAQISKRDRLADLPADQSRFLQDNRWDYDHQPDLGMHLIWEPNTSEDTRMGQIGTVSFLDVDEVPPVSRDARATGRLRGILKMIVNTPADQYDQPAAVELLKDFDEATVVNPEIQRMVDEKILVRHHAASSTGRFYSFAATWKQLGEGPLPEEIFHDAQALQEQLGASGDSLTWPLIGKAGEMAALMSMVSSQEVELDFDIRTFPSLMYYRDAYNTRKIGDARYEFEIKAKKSVPTTVSIVEAPPITRCVPARVWDDYDGQWTDSSNLVSNIMRHVAAVGPDGITKETLRDLLDVDQRTLDSALAHVARTKRPVFWAGYDTARLVSVKEWHAWTIGTRQMSIDARGNPRAGIEKGPHCAPRKWVDIWGNRLEREWEGAVRAGKGWLISRPGMTERIFREKLAPILDRLETNEVLQYLLDQGVAVRKWLVKPESRPGPVTTRNDEFADQDPGEGREEVINPETALEKEEEVQEREDMKARMMPPVEATDLEEEEGIVWWVVAERLLA